MDRLIARGRVTRKSGRLGYAVVFGRRAKIMAWCCRDVEC
jgi:hypothetical protein